MAFDIATNKHTVAFPSKVAASAGSPHIYDIHLASDTDNGSFVGRGDYISLGTYEEADAPDFAGTIVEQASNGNWYVEVTDDTEALFVYQSVVSPYVEKKFQVESLFYNEEGDTVKAYSLIKGDILEISEEGFDGTPAVGNTVSVSNKILAVAASE